MGLMIIYLLRQSERERERELLYWGPSRSYGRFCPPHSNPTEQYCSRDETCYDELEQPIFYLAATETYSMLYGHRSGQADQRGTSYPCQGEE